MDIIIFFKAIGNLLFAAILLLAVAFSTAFSLLTYMFRGSRLSVTGIKGLVRGNGSKPADSYESRF